MAASVFDSPLFAQLFATGETGRLFSDTATIRAMLLVEGALAKAQGAQGVIPELSAAAIHRASMEVQIDPGAVAKETGENGVSVPGLINAFRAEMNAPEHAEYVHWGATSQDIIDTALMLRLRQALMLAEAELRAIITAFGQQAETHAHLPMVARTFGQQAAPTTWGAVLAEIGAPLCDALSALQPLRASSLVVSLAGAVGTGAALGSKAAETRANLAAALGLQDPGRSWHVDRTPILRIVDWQGQVMAALAHMAETLMALTSTECAEVSLGSVGASSTMPNKQNPVRPAALLALSHQFTGLRSSLQTSAAHPMQRGGAAWFTEWLVLPQLVLSFASALGHAKTLSMAMAPRPVQMRAALDDGLGLIHAEALSFALCDRMQRMEAQSVSKALCRDAQDKNVSLADLALATYPDLDPEIFIPTAYLGQAPADARAFAKRAKDI